MAAWRRLSGGLDVRTLDAIARDGISLSDAIDGAGQLMAGKVRGRGR